MLFHLKVPWLRFQQATQQKSPSRVVKVLELCSGCGGLSNIALFGDEGRIPPPMGGAQIKLSHAVDNWPDAAASYKLNHPNAEVIRV